MNQKNSKELICGVSIYTQYSNFYIENSEFKNNRACISGIDSNVIGCIYNLLSIVDIRNCTFTNNSAFSFLIQKYTEALGDAIYLSNSNGSISTCVFQNNGVYSQKSNINDISNLKKM